MDIFELIDLKETEERYSVLTINRNDCYDYIMNIHYAKRFPPISYAYGLFEYGKLVGIITYGCPVSSTLRVGVCGKEYKDNVLELNRLCLLNNKKNEASILVGRSLKMLPDDKIIVSYADPSHGHIGYVYQATNFLYCGLSPKRSDWCIKGKEHLHHATVVDEFRGKSNRSELMREKYGNDFYSKPRVRKHRYVQFTGNKRFKKKARKSLLYGIEPYPKEKDIDRNKKE